MKDPYIFSSQYLPSEKTNWQQGSDGKAWSEASPKGPSKASVQKVLDFSKTYEVLDKGDGSDPFGILRN